MDDDEFTRMAALEDRHWWFRARREIMLEQIRRHAPPPGLMVEIGCGTGGNLKLLGQHYPVLGIDIAPRAVALARQRIPHEIQCGDFREVLRGRWAEVTAVVLMDVLEHVDDDLAFAHDLFAALKPGARVFITVPADGVPFSRHDTALGHVRRYSRERFVQLWRGLPVRLERLTAFNTLLLPVVWLARRLSRGESGGSDVRQHSAFGNAVLYRLFSLERLLLRHVALPVGVSLLAVLTKE